MTPWDHCSLPPGWTCSRPFGHEGPCAAERTDLTKSDFCSCGCEEPLTNAELKLISTQLRLKKAVELLTACRNALPKYFSEEYCQEHRLRRKVDAFLKEQT